uniref:Putative secreted protein n=1 Tax=Amblyomma cajennense TaxID=34607 RepID=A0A023FDE8_AMBCJ
MNALFLLGFAFAIGMMTCEGKQIAGSPIVERSSECMVDCARGNGCPFGQCLCYTKGDFPETCISKEEARGHIGYED